MKISFANVYSRHMVVPERRENSPQGENMVRGFDRIIDKVAASSDVYQPTNEVHPRRLSIITAILSSSLAKQKMLEQNRPYSIIK